MNDKVDLAEKLSAVQEHWSLVLDGRLTIQLRDRDVELDAGQLFVVPGGSSIARAPTRRPACSSSSRSARPTPVTPGAGLTATEERI